MEIQRPEAFVLRVFLHLVSLGLQLHSLLRVPGVRPVAGHASYMEPVGTMWNFLCCVSMRNKSCSSLLGLLGENATDLKKIKKEKKRKQQQHKPKQTEMPFSSHICTQEVHSQGIGKRALLDLVYKNINPVPEGSALWTQLPSVSSNVFTWCYNFYMGQHRRKPSVLSNLVYQISRKTKQLVNMAVDLQSTLCAGLVTQGSSVCELGLKCYMAISSSGYMAESVCMLSCGMPLRSRPQ